MTEGGVSGQPLFSLAHQEINELVILKGYLTTIQIVLCKGKTCSIYCLMVVQCDPVGIGHASSLLTEAPIFGLDFGLEKPYNCDKDANYSTNWGAEPSSNLVKMEKNGEL